MNITHMVDPLVYDYSQITDATMRTMAQRAADEIKPRLRRATEDILIIGQRLAVVRQYLPHGQWMAWVEAEFGMDYQTAHNFTRVADRFGDKSINFINLKPSALYMLAAPSTPDEAIAEVESLVTNGYTPTVAETKQIIAEHKPGKTIMQIVSDEEEQDIAARLAAVDAAVTVIPNAYPDARNKVDRLYAAVDTARAWLADYRGPHGAGWSVMTDSQIHHANSPCYQAFVRAYPEIEHPKEALASALLALRKGAEVGGHKATPQPRQSDDKNDLSPQNPPAPLPADEGREWVRIQGLHGVLSQMFILLTGEHRTTAEAYGFGVEYQRLLGEVESLRREVKGLTPGDKMTR